MKRTWLTNVDYKNGGLLTDKKSRPKSFGNKKTDETGEENNGKKGKKSKFLSKHHKEQHDNIFSKKFKNNTLKNDKRRKTTSK